MSDPSKRLSSKEQAIFDDASTHPYECECDACKLWWANVPPEDDSEDIDDDEPAF